jgi:NAD(P)-dependent dehydrogenase (short-subunit alcohol dehydrogenase family)
MQRFDVSDKVAVVTGGSRGIGLAIADGLSQAGARVVVSSRSGDDCVRVAAEITDRTGNEVLAVPCDVGDWEAVPAFVDEIAARFGRVDVLVNNAGMYSHQPILHLTEAEVDRVFNVNFKGALRVSALTVPLMSTHGGSIINVSSVGARRPHANAAHYDSSKAALCTLTQVMAMEWGHLGIRVNSVLPGPTLTSMIRGIEDRSPGTLDRSADKTVLGRVGDPEEFVGIALFLASKASSFVTGAEHVVSGGYA